jgi:hypothetical protein
LGKDALRFFVAGFINGRAGQGTPRLLASSIVSLIAPAGVVAIAPATETFFDGASDVVARELTAGGIRAR